MPIAPALMDDLKRAMREKDTLARDTLRLLKSELDRAALDKGAPLSDDEELAVVARAVKTRRETIEQARAGGRAESAEAEAQEIALLERYLPRALDDAETRAAIRAIIERTGASGAADLGRVMQALMAEHRGRIDGKRAKALASELLG